MGLFIACLLGGWFGLHKFIEKKIGIGLLYFFTCGLCGIGWFIDCIIYGIKAFEKTTPPKITTIKTESPKSEIVKPITQTVPATKTKKHKVTGMSHYMDNIMTLAIENDDYQLSKKELLEECLENDTIYEYDFYCAKIELVPEPDNPYDTNAVKVLLDGLHVGYIKSGSCSHILKLINENRIEKMDCEIGGGKYKYLAYDDYEDTYDLIKDYCPIFIHLFITEK